MSLNPNNELTITDSHEYYLGGRRLPGVTEVLEDVGVIKTDWYTDEGAQRGKTIHSILEEYDEGELDESRLNDRFKPILAGYQDFQKSFKINLIEIERRRHSAHFMYAGTPDRLVSFNGEKAVLDFKSGSCPKWVELQLAAYAGLFPFPVKRFALKFSKEGEWSLKEYKNPTDFNVFLSCLNVFNWKGK